MASAAEQLATNINFGALSKATELKKRIWFTLFALVVYRLGTYIPVPGIDPVQLEQVFQQQASGILGLGRMTIFALNIMPYISASIIMQLLTAVSPSLEAMKKEGESGRKKINQYTRYGTVVLAAFQAYGISVGLQNLLASTLELGRTGALSTGLILVLFIMAVAVIAFIVFMERAQRRILVQYPKRQMGNKTFGGESSHLPLKLNPSGVIPPIFASSLLLLPLTVASFSGQGTGPQWLTLISTYVAHGQPLYMFLYVALIVFFAFFYTTIVFNPADTADNLKKNGGFIPGIRPGKNTAVYLNKILMRLVAVGAAYLSLVSLLPEILVSELAVPFYFGGTSLLIVVSVTMDTVAQIHSHLLAQQYEGLIKKAKLKGRRG